jgi:probable HAF family extracellular repeat protein
LNKVIHSGWAILCVLVCIISHQSAFAQTYSVMDLGVMFVATGINGSGEALGNSAIPQANNQTLPWVLDNGAAVLLPTTTSLGFSNAILGYGINDSGVVVGSAELPVSAGVVNEGFVYAPGASTLTILPSLASNQPAAGEPTIAYSINDTGQITGTSIVVPGTQHAFVYQAPTMTDLGTLGGGNFSVGYAINATGQVTGQADTATANTSHAFFYSNGAMSDLGTLGGTNSTGTGISAGGQIVGYSDTTSTSSGTHSVHAFLYANATMLDLGALGGTSSQALAINDLGQVTGTYTAGEQLAFLYSAGKMSDLTQMIGSRGPLAPRITLYSGNGINANGWIAATGMTSNGTQAHAFLLVPVSFVPGALSFANQLIGTTSAAQSITLTNTGTASFSISGISITGSFAQTNACPANLTSGASCAISVTFAPVSGGSNSGAVLVSSGPATLSEGLAGAGTITTTLTSSVSNPIVGTPIILTWSATVGSTCMPSGGSVSDGWRGTLAASGSKSVSEAVAGNFNYAIACTNGTYTAQAKTLVVYNWPAVTATIAASPTSINQGQATTLTWSSTNANSCVATGGGPNDGWTGNKGVSGSQAITETYALATPSTQLTFTISCTATASSLSNQASADVTVNAPPSSSGGGGVFDYWSLVAILTIFGLRNARNRLMQVV